MAEKFVTHGYKCSHPGCDCVFYDKDEAVDHERVKTRLPAYNVGEIVGYIEGGQIIIVEVIECYPILAHSFSPVKYAVKYFVADGIEPNENDEFVATENDLCDLEGHLREDLIFDPIDSERE